MVVTFFIGYLAFFIAFSVSYSLGKGRLLKGGLFFLGILLAVVAGAIAFGMTRSVPNDLSAQISQLATAYFLLVPVSSVGLGMAVASLVGYFEGSRVTQVVILSVAASLPIGVGLILYQQNESVERTKERFRAEMELTNVSGAFGSNVVTIPVSPIVSIGTRCKVEQGQSPNTCNASFRQPNTYEFFQGFEATDLDFSWLVIRNPGNDCWVKANCEQFEEWCSRRTDLADSAWCWGEREIAVKMRSDPKQQNEEDLDVPLLKLSSPIPDLRARCRYHPKTVNCKVHFLVTHDIRTILSISEIVPGREEAAVLEAKAYVDRLWSEMTGE
ncbi:hypothetical protein [Ruegeria lacuscaerulensis]|uniref:hypothetical protein n=1 Tax=Ruegeria lacuscaerulensis TaxID=55218 RepID=UPI00147CF834|nr:hypothetical protein [Ruegeria lacuscaerulensis]